MSFRSMTLAAGVAVAALVAGALLFPTTGFSQTDAAPADTVTVTAAGEVEGRPDLGAVTFGIGSRAATAQATMDGLSLRQNRVIDALRSLGLSADEVTTGNISLNRFCPYDSALQQRVCEGYIARTSIRAETAELDQVGEIIDTGVEAGASSVRGISFERSEQNEAINEALAQAMDLAMTKAELLATRSGRELGRALVIEEGGAERPVLSPSAVAFDNAGTTRASKVVINPSDKITKVRIVVTFALN